MEESVSAVRRWRRLIGLKELRGLISRVVDDVCGDLEAEAVVVEQLVSVNILAGFGVLK